MKATRYWSQSLITAYSTTTTGFSGGVSVVLASDYDALAARLAEADALIAKGLAVVHDFLPNIGRCVLQDYQRMNEFCSEAAARTAVSAVQPERCCVDYPRCDCNSPAEMEAACVKCGYKPWATSDSASGVQK